jgi:hypothetical protein
MNRSRIAVAAGLIAALSFASAGCQEEGPAERAGKALDEAAEDAQEGLEELGDDDGALEEAGEAVDEAYDEAEEKAEEAVE